MPNLTLDGYLSMLENDKAEFISAVSNEPQILGLRGLHGETMLHFLAIEGNLQGVELLLSLGAEPDANNRLGTTALIDAATLGNFAMVSLLLSGKADPNKTNSDGSTALHYAAEHEHRAVFELLINHGGVGTLANGFGETPDGLLAS